MQSIPVIGSQIPFLIGRGLLGLYFLVPGITKVLGFEQTLVYMETHGVPLAVPLLVVTIILQVGGGLALMIGFRTMLVGLTLAALTLAINIFMHDFWNTYEGVDQGHETQNFIKNLAIFAGLLVLAASAGPAREEA